MGTLIKNGNLLQEWPSLFDDFITRDLFHLPGGNQRNSTLPAVNIKETENSFELEVAAPGMDKKDFKIELDNNLLTISAEREAKSEEKNKEGEFTRREFSYQSFTRSFGLPANKVQGDKIAAKYHDGILHISVPKTEEAKLKPVRQIQIS